MAGNLKAKPATRRDAADTVRLKAAGEPAHINAHEARLLERLMPEAAGPVITKGLLAEAGVMGDNRVTKLTSAGRALLKRHGGSGDRNPITGLLQFDDGEGGSSNPGGGHNGDSGGGGYGGGGYGGPSSSPGGGNYSSNYSAGVGYGFSAAPDPGLSYNDISNFGGIGRPGGMTVDPDGNVSFSGRPGDLTNFGLASEYAPLDTIKRLVQTAIFGPPKQYNVAPESRVPGVHGIPNGIGPGLAKKAAATLAGPAGPMVSGMMTLGGWMRDSMSPETQAASLAENQATGAKNSTGNRTDLATGMSVAAMAQATPGVRSGAETAQLLAPPGYTRNPAGQLVPLPGGNNRPAWRDPLRNLIADYIIRGRSGSGWG